MPGARLCALPPRPRRRPNRPAPCERARRRLHQASTPPECRRSAVAFSNPQGLPPAPHHSQSRGPSLASSPRQARAFPPLHLTHIHTHTIPTHTQTKFYWRRREEKGGATSKRKQQAKRNEASARKEIIVLVFLSLFFFFVLVVVVAVAVSCCFFN